MSNPEEKTKSIIEQIFKSFSLQYGLEEFKDIIPEEGFTKAFGNKIIEMAREDKRIVAITAAMPDGTGLDKFANLFPDRFFKEPDS